MSVFGITWFVTANVHFFSIFSWKMTRPFTIVQLWAISAAAELFYYIQLDTLCTSHVLCADWVHDMQYQTASYDVKQLTDEWQKLANKSRLIFHDRRAIFVHGFLTFWIMDGICHNRCDMAHFHAEIILHAKVQNRLQQHYNDVRIRFLTQFS